MSDVRALLMTDLVDSTGTTQRLGEAVAAQLWIVHDRLVRALLSTWRGLEIDKSDGFLLIFDQVADAAHFALAYQRGLADLPAAVASRVAVHVAPVVLRANVPADVERGAKPVEVESWLAKALAARLMALAAGGQTLLSADAAAALGGAGFQLHRHGHWRLQGIAEPIELFELGEHDTPAAPPPDGAKAYRVVERGGLWLPRRELRHSLPAERDVYIGRAAVLADLAAQLHAGSRLVSVLGTGGIGKTRLAQRFGWLWLGDYPGGVWFCDLAAAQGPDGICYAVAQGLDLPLDRSEPIVQIGRALAGRGLCLVILDNFEQVAAHAEATVGRWMQLAPEARFIVTTREVLGITGEHAFALAPLPPAEAAALFECRAHDVVRHRAAGSADDAAAILPLVGLLDGLPLAIELAAARVRVMSPRALLNRMGERFKLLAAPGRSLKRQSTLRATLDWSWDLLSPVDRSALAQVSAFEGGFSLADAEAVLDLATVAVHGWVPDAVQSLVEKSMLRAMDGGRFELLRSVQAYATEHLATPGRFDGSGPALQAAVQARHWQHFAALDERAAVADGCAAADNLVAACRRACAAGDAAAAVGALAGVWAVLRLTGPFRLALELGHRVGALAALGAAGRGTVQRIIGSANELLGEVDAARASFDAALAEAQAARDACGEAWALCALGEHLYKRGHPKPSRRCLDQARQLAIGLSHPALHCAVLNALGTLEMRLGRADEARVAYTAALALARALGDASREAGLLGNLAMLAHEAGAEDRAQQQYAQALALTVRLHDRRWEGNTRCNLGLLHQDRGQPAEARLQFERALAIARDIGHAMLEATVLCNLGILLDASGEFSVARDHHERAVDVAQRLGDRRAEGQFRGHLGECLARCGGIEAGFQQLDAGEAALREAGDEASLDLLLCQRALVQHLAGDKVAAQASLGRARQRPNAAEPGDLRRAIERAQQVMRAG